VIPEIDICRIANLMLKRYDDITEVEIARRVDELAADGDSTVRARSFRVGSRANCPLRGSSSSISCA
jgi:hypothetical protein